MRQTCLTASWFFGTFGALLLVCSLVLVPQSRALADDGTGTGTITPGTCNGDDCEIGNCFNNPNVDPDNGCQGGTCDTTSQGCDACKCVKFGSINPGCKCLKPAP